MTRLGASTWNTRKARSNKPYLQKWFWGHMSCGPLFFGRTLGHRGPNSDPAIWPQRMRCWPAPILVFETGHPPSVPVTALPLISRATVAAGQRTYYVVEDDAGQVVAQAAGPRDRPRQNGAISGMW